MTSNNQDKEDNSSDITSFNSSDLSTLQYIKIVFIDQNKELYEMRSENSSIDDNKIKLCIKSSEKINMPCPSGVILKFITSDSIFFAKAILQEIKWSSDNYTLILKTPQKTIRKQKRRFYRINMNRYCILSVNNDHYIAQSINVSKGGILLHNTETIIDDKIICPKISKNSTCYITMFLEHDLKVKTHAKLIRAERIDDSYRYAFEFINIALKYIVPFNKYTTSEEIKALKISNLN